MCNSFLGKFSCEQRMEMWDGSSRELNDDFPRVGSSQDSAGVKQPV